MKISSVFTWTGIVSAAFLLGGCTGTPDYSSLPKQISVTRQENPSYRIQSGDVLEIRFPLTAKHNDQVTVRPDGKIFIEIAGEVKAAGMRPIELAGRLETLTSHRLKSPQIIVKVAQSSQKIYVGGEVESQGPVPYRDDLTPLQAITERGGFKNTADSGRVFVVNIANKEAKITEIDFSQMSTIQLSANDVVFIPKTGISEANLVIEQYIRNMLPFDWIRFW